MNDHDAVQVIVGDIKKGLPVNFNRLVNVNPCGMPEILKALGENNYTLNDEKREWEKAKEA